MIAPAVLPESGPAASLPDPPGPPRPRAALLLLLRPKQWIKNAFVLAPLVFAGRAADTGALLHAAAAAGLFVLASALVYVFNDLVDAEADRRHPLKRATRPIAAGWVPELHAVGLWVVLAFALAAGIAAKPSVAPAVAAFVGLNASYSVWLKHVPVLDLLSVGAGYILRLWAGAAAIGVPLSRWMMVTALCLSVFLAAAKRMTERARSGPGARAVLGRYSAPVLVWITAAAGVGAFACYVSYVAAMRPNLWPTIPLVALGLGRFGWLLRRRQVGECPTDALWDDAVLLGIVALWIALSLLIVPVVTP